MNKQTLSNIKESLSSCALVIELLILPIFILFIVLMSTTSIVSSNIAKQLNITFVNIVIIAYAYYMIPIISVIVTIKAFKRKKLSKIIQTIMFSAITEFITTIFILINFNLTANIEIISIETSLYYAAVSMIWFIAIAFFITGVWLIYNKIEKPEETHRELLRLEKLRDEERKSASNND